MTPMSMSTWQIKMNGLNRPHWRPHNEVLLSAVSLLFFDSVFSLVGFACLSCLVFGFSFRFCFALGVEAARGEGGCEGTGK